MNYKEYTAEDFASDLFFIRWVKHADEESVWFWNTFIKENPEKLTTIREAKSLLGILDFREEGLSRDDFLVMKNRLMLAVREEEEKESVPTRDLYPTRWIRILQIAASLTLIFLLGYFTINKPFNLTNEPDLVTSDFSDDETEVRSNPSGQKSVLSLPDGTQVWLNAASTLVYEKAFGKQKIRQVYLEGEAFFKVVHDPEKPFHVNTASDIRIEVLGTSFNVKSYMADETVETTLVDGKVSIDKRKRGGGFSGNLVLRPNQRAVYFKQSNTINVEEVAAKKVSSWKENHLVFDDVPFYQVIVQLERWYDVEIRIESDLKLDCRLTASIEDETLENVLKLLETSHQIEYQIHENKVILSKIVCQ